MTILLTFWNSLGVDSRYLSQISLKLYDSCLFCHFGMYFMQLWGTVNLSTPLACFLCNCRVDFDLFNTQAIKRKNIRNLIERSGFTVSDILYEAFDQIHIVINSVKITFFKFSHKIVHPMDFDGIIKIPKLLDLAAMKTPTLQKSRILQFQGVQGSSCPDRIGTAKPW